MAIGQDRPVRCGTWLYDGKVESRVEIWRRAERPGSGDDEDDAAIANDQPGEWYEVRYTPAGGGAAGQAGGGFHSTLKAAMESVRASTNETVRWDHS
jgi:hypothetical protein